MSKICCKECGEALRITGADGVLRIYPCVECLRAANEEIQELAKMLQDTENELREALVKLHPGTTVL
jgi:hypothetical protein